MFFALSKDGLLYQSTDITDLPKSNTILCYLKQTSGYEHKTQLNIYTWYKYEFVDINETPVNFKIGTCEVVFIEKDDGLSYLKARAFTIRDQYSREGKYIIRGKFGDSAYPYIESIATKLVPFMLELSSYGGWDGYWSKTHPSNPDIPRIVIYEHQ